jgi:squalene synthase HpnC
VGDDADGHAGSPADTRHATGTRPVDAPIPDVESALLAELAARAPAQAQAENFPVALRLLPRGPRTQLARVYAFARFVDDVGDEAPGDRLALLDAVARDVRAVGTGRARLQPVRDLRPLLDDGVPLEPFLDLVEANRVDQRVSAYETFDDLLGYCRLSAAPVGRIVLHVAHAADARNVADSDAVCAALQVLEHCQDVGEDARNGRVYLPAADLRAGGVVTAELTAATTSAPLRSVIAMQIDRATELLDPGRPLVRRLSGWARVAVAGYVAGGLATVTALRAADGEVLAHPVHPAKARTALYALRLVAGR